MTPEEFEEKLEELWIRFNTSPKLYLKKDFKTLLDVLLYLADNSGGGGLPVNLKTINYESIVGEGNIDPATFYLDINEEEVVEELGNEAREYVKLFNTPQDADGYEVWDKPFIATIKSTHQNIHIDDNLFEMDDFTLKNSNGEINVEHSYPFKITGYNPQTRDKYTMHHNKPTTSAEVDIISKYDIIKLGTVCTSLSKNYFQPGRSYWQDYDVKVLMVPSSVIDDGDSPFPSDIYSPFTRVDKLEKVIWDTPLWASLNLSKPSTGYNYGIDSYFYNASFNNILFVLGKNVGTLGTYSFYNSLIQHIVLHEDLTLSEGTFMKAHLKTITLPSKLTTIPSHCFEDCTDLTSIEIPSSVTSIGTKAFYGSNILDLTVPNGVTSIGTNAFYNVENVLYNGDAEGAPWGAKIINGVWNGPLLLDSTETVVASCRKDTEGDVIIPNTVTSIMPDAFRNCSSLTSVTVPDSVTNIGSSAFMFISNTFKTIIDTLKDSYTDKLYATSSPQIAQIINTFNVQFNSVEEGTFSGDYNVANSLFVTGGAKSTYTYNIYTDDQTICDQMEEFATNQYTVVNLYHLDGTNWSQ